VSDPADRLDSWKAIADYLGRDTRTLRRWEERGLPVRRIAGARGGSVFAFKSEIDAWMRAGGTLTSADPVQEPAAPAPHAAPATTAWPPWWRRHSRVLAGVVLFVAIVAGWYTFAPVAGTQALTIGVDETAIIARASSGDERWRFTLPADVVTVISDRVAAASIVMGQHPGVYVMDAYAYRRSDSQPIGGTLRRLSLDGQLEQAFSFRDRWTFQGRAYDEPWALADFSVSDAFGRRRVAVASHHYTWWPSVVTILDERFQRESTFVNSGWVDRVKWLSPDRLAITGFHQSLNGGMFAVLDGRNIDGTSPETTGPYQCDDCRPGSPVFYAVFPRSELNRVSGAPFNRATLEVGGAGILLHTDEEARPGQAGSLTDAIYEFSPDLQLVRASYGDRYWDRHRALELEGRLRHTRDNCPERDGPPRVEVWTPATGWTTIRPPH
jgi:hypothetical protein